MFRPSLKRHDGGRSFGISFTFYCSKSYNCNTKFSVTYRICNSSNDVFKNTSNASSTNRERDWLNYILLFIPLVELKFSQVGNAALYGPSGCTNNSLRKRTKRPGHQNRSLFVVPLPTYGLRLMNEDRPERRIIATSNTFIAALKTQEISIPTKGIDRYNIKLVKHILGHHVCFHYFTLMYRIPKLLYLIQLIFIFTSIKSKK